MDGSKNIGKTICLAACLVAGVLMGIVILLSMRRAGEEEPDLVFWRQTGGAEGYRWENISLDYIEFANDSRYGYLSGTIYCRAGYGDRRAVSLQIYADDVLIYDSGRLTRETRPENFEIAIGSVRIVRIIGSYGNQADADRGPRLMLINLRAYNK